MAPSNKKRLWTIQSFFYCANSEIGTNSDIGKKLYIIYREILIDYISITHSFIGSYVPTCSCVSGSYN